LAKHICKIMKYFPQLIIVVGIICTTTNSKAQGCSDAGFCTIGNLAPSPSIETKKQKLTLLLPFGLGDEKVFVFAPGIQYENQFNNRWSIQAKLTANTANGNLGNATGLGDVYLSGTYSWPTKKGWRVSATLGTKLPLNQSDLQKGNRSLPMQYQSSLGTIDLITGLAITNDQWQFAAGLQQPLSGINRNHFLPIYWNNADAARYPPSNDFNRKGDVLLRASYTYDTHKKFRFNAGLLGIYHLQEDTYIDAAYSKSAIMIKGSKGLTLNATVAAWYRLGSRFQLGLVAGTPLAARDIRPDGLTRKFVVAPEISWNF